MTGISAEPTAAPVPTTPTTADTTPPGRLKRAWKAIVAGALLVLSKLKLLLVGLTKIKTLLSMLVFMGVYWELWGWPFALGFVLCIYIHEMGHVSALRRYGIPASAPMFIPFIGALIRLKQAPATVQQDARVGLAGPIWGLGAALIAYAIFLATQAPIFGAIAKTAGFLNLFNLIPFWQLDGGRGFRTLSRDQRWIAIAAIGITFALSLNHFLAIIGIAAIFRAFGRNAPKERDWPVLGTYIGLIASLTALAQISVNINR